MIQHGAAALDNQKNAGSWPPFSISCATGVLEALLGMEQQSASSRLGCQGVDTNATETLNLALKEKKRHHQSQGNRASQCRKHHPGHSHRPRWGSGSLIMVETGHSHKLAMTANQSPSYISPFPKKLGNRNLWQKQSCLVHISFFPPLAVLCDNLEGWDGVEDGRESQEGGDICILMADSC